MAEQKIQNEIRLALSQAGSTMFRNNTAMAWVGSKVERFPCGKVFIHDARPLHAGLCEGSSDLIGWTPVEITPEMVGKTLAVFTAVEVKSATGRASGPQKNFIDQVQKAGGAAGVARSGEDAKEIVEEAKKNNKLF